MTQARSTRPVVTGLAFPECPRWRDGRLWFADQHGGQVYRVEADGSVTTVADVPGGASGLGWLPDGTPLVVSMDDCALYRLAGDEPQLHARLRPHHRWLSNDMVVDDSGRAYVGSIGFDYYGGAPAEPSTLVRVDPDGTVAPVADGLHCPNGAVIMPDGVTLVVAESLAGRLTAFDVAVDGALHNRRVHADLGDRIPDGICRDSQGRIWFASIGRHEVVRIDPDGAVSAVVSTGDREALACALGGTDEDVLFVCTSASMRPELTRANRDGRVEMAEVAAG